MSARDGASTCLVFLGMGMAGHLLVLIKVNAAGATGQRPISSIAIKVSALHGGVVSRQRITLDLPKACASCACAEFAAAEALCIGRSLALKQNRNFKSLPPAEGIRGWLATVTVSGQTCVKPAPVNHGRRITAHIGLADAASHEKQQE